MQREAFYFIFCGYPSLLIFFSLEREINWRKVLLPEKLLSLFFFSSQRQLSIISKDDLNFYLIDIQVATQSYPGGDCIQEHMAPNGAHVG